jgi:hypothetical protein
VSAWQNDAISRDTMLHNFRTGEFLPPMRTNEQELELIKRDAPPIRGILSRGIKTSVG